MTSYPKRLIEVDLPIKRISAHARREKSIRHGHISTLHIWWARRPLAACRAVICAALWPDPADEFCPQAFRDAAAACLISFARRVFPERITAESKPLQETASPQSLARWESFLKSGVGLNPADADHQNVLRFALLDFIADFSNWDNSTVPAYLQTARRLTGVAHQALSDPGYRLPQSSRHAPRDETAHRAERDGYDHSAWLSTLSSRPSRARWWLIRLRGAARSRSKPCASGPTPSPAI
jgi:hypothetical protein